MRELATVRPVIAPMSSAAVDRVVRLEAASLAHMPQVSIPVDHFLYAGLYQRTIMIPAGVVLTGALIKVPTLLIVSGDAVVHTEDGPIELYGYHILQAHAGRKQAFVALTDTHLTMVFPTAARTVEEAEREFTDEFERLQNRRKET